MLVLVLDLILLLVLVLLFVLTHSCAFLNLKGLYR